MKTVIPLPTGGFPTKTSLKPAGNAGASAMPDSQAPNDIFRRNGNMRAVTLAKNVRGGEKAFGTAQASQQKAKDTFAPTASDETIFTEIAT